jgi:hypothetical protein
MRRTSVWTFLWRVRLRLRLSLRQRRGRMTGQVLSFRCIVRVLRIACSSHVRVLRLKPMTTRVRRVVSRCHEKSSMFLTIGDYKSIHKCVQHMPMFVCRHRGSRGMTRSAMLRIMVHAPSHASAVTRGCGVRNFKLCVRDFSFWEFANMATHARSSSLHSTAQSARWTTTQPGG